MADNTKVNIQITAEDLTTAVMTGVQEGMKRVEAAINKTGATSKKTASDLNDLAQATPAASSGLDTLISRYGGLAAATAAATAAIKSSIEAALGMEKINAMLKSATGSAEEAGLAYQFIRQEANRLGLDIETSAKSFAKFSASARGTSLEGEGVQKVFTGVAEAGAAMKLSTEEMDGVLLALSQMMSKGTVQAEELRGQVGERLPGAYKLSAEAMGLTEQELGKQLELGQVMATDMLPKLAEKLHQVYGPAAAQAAQDTTANFARLKNEVFEQAAAFGKDLLPAVNMVLSALSGGIQVVGAMIKMFKDLSSIVFAAGFAMAEFAKLILGGGLFSEEGRKEFEDGMINIKETLLAQLNDMGAAQDKYYKTEADREEESAEMEQRRLEKAKKIIEANKKAQLDYIKTIADQEARLTADYRAEYEKKRDIINAHFDSQLKAVAKGSADEIRLNNEKQDALAKLERERATYRAQIDLQVRETALKQMAAQMQAEIAQVEAKLAKQEISEREAAAKISALRKQQADEELKLAEQRVSILAMAGLQGTEEYRKALGEQVRAQKEVNGLMMAEINRVKTEKKAVLDQELSAAQNAYQADLNALKESEINKSLSVEESTLKRLKLERDYQEQLASIRATELAQYDPQTQVKEYQAALAAKLDADKAYLAAKQAVDAEEAKQFAASTAKHAEEIKNKIEAEKAALEQSRAFAADWFAQWDAAYNNASQSLQGLSDAAYNTFAEIEGLPLKSAESLDALKKKAEEAATSYGKLYRTAKEAGLQVGAAWGDAYNRLNMIPAEAARITAEFYRQKVAAEELAIAMQQPANATGLFVQQAEQALTGMSLLDKASLDTLKGSIQKIKDEMAAFTDQVREALKSLQDEWDNLTMSKLQLEEKRYQEQRLQWQKDYDLAKQQGNDEAIKALYQQLELIEKINKANVATLSADEANLIAPKIPGMATGGRVGGIGTGDNQLRWLDPREWVMHPGAVSHWGADIMAAMNAPFSQAGQMLAQRLNGINVPSMAINPPRMAMATGGNVGNLQQAGATISLTINTTQPVDDTFIRRKIIPELERYARLKM